MSEPTYDNGIVRLYRADARALPLPDQSVDCVVTSPPYWGLRDYGVDGQIGMESTPEAYVCAMVEVFREVWRVLKPTGTLWLNLGDSYAGSGKGLVGDGTHSPAHGSKQGTNKGTTTFIQEQRSQWLGLKPKDLVGIPWRVAFALQADGWYLRSDIIWAKPNPMPESVTDRPTRSHEYLFLLSKSERYYYDADAIREPHSDVSMARVKRPFHLSAHVAGRAVNAPEDGDMTRFLHEGGRNKRSVWTVPASGFREAHFATFPEALIEPCILAGCPEGGVVLDPFIGSGTTAAVAQRLGRKAVGCDLNDNYLAMAARRIGAVTLPLGLA